MLLKLMKPCMHALYLDQSFEKKNLEDCNLYYRPFNIN